MLLCICKNIFNSSKGIVRSFQNSLSRRKEKESKFTSKHPFFDQLIEPQKQYHRQKLVTRIWSLWSLTFQDFISIRVRTPKSKATTLQWMMVTYVTVKEVKLGGKLPIKKIIPAKNFSKSLRCDLHNKIEARKFYIRRNKNKVDSIETGPIVIAHLLP